MRRPLLALGALFMGGVLSVDEEAGPIEAAILLGLSALLLALALAAAVRPSTVAVGASAFALGAAAGAVEGVGLGAAPLLRLVEAGALTDRPALLVGLADGDLEVVDGRARLSLEVARLERRRGVTEPCRGRAAIEIGGPGPLPLVADGDEVTVWASLRAARAGRLTRRGPPHAVPGYCKSARLVERVAPGGAGPVRRAAAALRARMRSALRSVLPPGPERGLVLAMVLGDRSEIDRATSEAFRASGTYHVLALSGAQVAFVAGLLVGGLRCLRFGPTVQALVATAAVGFYAVLVGGDAPVVRAAVMAAAILLGRALELDGDPANLLGLAGLGLLAASPSQASEVGFQLSFAATLGILLLTGPLSDGLPRLPLRAELLLAASLAAQLALTPLLAGHFHRLAPAALGLNLAAVPLSAAVLVLGAATALAEMLVPGGVGLLAGAAWIAGHALRRSGDLGAFGDGIDIRVGGPTAIVLALHLVGLVQVARGRRVRGLTLLALAHALLIAGWVSPGDGRLHLTALDVGQGDALLLRSPSGRAVLVDAGGSYDGRYDVGERVVGPDLWSAGVRRLDTLVLTHAHPDHVGGARAVLRAFGVDEVWEGPAAPPDPQWQRMDAVLREAGVRRLGVIRGRRVLWDDVTIEVLGPRPRGRAPRRVRNEDSVVLCLRIGEVVLLLAGDVQGEAEESLAPPRAAVVKVPHHGSRSSSGPRFVAATAPLVAIVSAGARNPFGHPHGEVLDRYARSGALVLRTDRDGDVHVATDGRRIWIRRAGEAKERRLR